MYKYKRTSYGIITAFMILAVASLACSLPGSKNDDTGNDARPTVVSTIYQGVNAGALDPHAGSFSADFTPRGGAEPWHYEGTFSRGDSAGQQDLSMDGLPPEIDLGDVTLVYTGGMQYMTGPGTGESQCLLFPADVDLSEAFLTPDNFIPADVLPDDILSKGDKTTVAGQNGTEYTFENASFSDYKNASGTLVIGDNDALLFFEFEGDTIDNMMLDGVKGRQSFTYEITEVGSQPGQEVPELCIIDLPLMPDATRIAKLPNMVVFESPSTLAEVVAFYEEQLPAQGWGVYEFPQVDADASVLTYARGGKVLSVSIEIQGDGVEVRMFTENQ